MIFNDKEELKEGSIVERQLPLALPPETVNELNAWSLFITALKDGLPIPNNPLINIRRIERIEEATGADYTKLKECCSMSAEVREAKDLKPYVFAAIERVVHITNLKIPYRQGDEYYER